MMYRCVDAAAITLVHTCMPVPARSGAAGGGAAGAAATSGLIRLLPWRLGPARQLTASWLSAGGSNGLLPSRTAFASMKPTTTGDGTTSGSCSALPPTPPITRSGRGSWAPRGSGRAARRGWLVGAWCPQRLERGLIACLLAAETSGSDPLADLTTASLTGFYVRSASPNGPRHDGGRARRGAATVTVALTLVQRKRLYLAAALTSIFLTGSFFGR